MTQTAFPPALRQERIGLHHNNFDLLRFALAVGVIVSHAYPLLLGAAVSEPLLDVTHGQFTLGKLCVAGFFIISGFLVTGSWQRTATPLNYLLKRGLRIFPGLAAALLVCIFVVVPLGGAVFPSYLHAASTWKVLSIITMRDPVPVDSLPGVFSHLAYPDLMGTTWTLRFEFGCYLLVLVLGMLQVFKNRTAGVAVTGGLLLLSLAAGHYVEAHKSALRGTVVMAPHLVVYFVAGSLAYLLRERIPHSRWLALACAAGIVLCRAHFLDDVMPIAGTYLLLYCAFSESVRLPHFGGKVDLSYGLYLYGWPVEQLLVYHFGAHLSPITLIAAALPISAALAWASWNSVERPCLLLKTRMPRRRQAASLPAAAA